MYRVPEQHGRRVVITGANSGTGKETARRLAGAGARVVLAVRTLGKGEEARSAILHEHPDAEVEVRHLDLADLSSVRSFAAELLDEDAPIDVLVNNAGVMVPPARVLTVDGFELQFGTNFLGPFALTNLLLPRLLRSESPRVATMSSSAAVLGRIRFEDLQFAARYRASAAYAQSKLADLLMARQLATIAEERGWRLLSTAAHPGYTRTNLQSSGPSLGRRRPSIVVRTVLALVPSQDVVQGTEPLLFAAVDPTAEQGAYYGPCRSVVGPTTAARLPRSAQGVDLAASLWSVAEDLTGTSVHDLQPTKW